MSPKPKKAKKPKLKKREFIGDDRVTGNMNLIPLGFVFKKHLINSSQIMLGDVLSVKTSGGKIHCVCTAEGVLWGCYKDGFKAMSSGNLSSWTDEFTLVDRVKGQYRINERMANIYLLYCMYTQNLYVSGSKDTHLHKRVLRYDFEPMLDLISERERTPSTTFANRLVMLNAWIKTHRDITDNSLIVPHWSEKNKIERIFNAYHGLRVNKGTSKKVIYLTSKKAVKKRLLAILRELN